MKANELRIGNWVRQRESDTYIQIEQYLLCNEELCHYQPIKLTEEWLLKFGFAKQDYTMSGCSIYKLGNIVIMNSFVNPQRESMVITIEGISPPTWSLKDLCFVHQLQNIYFALTGKELTYVGNK
jgi:hypothetical protein